ncbi:hypothetical protein CMV_024957 [Castanea mollissima]|uniref:Uncharacterized protein n=1 Tax=Castanea mollissima TaxID=60419 RepID=A0A8J4QED8_9ROSI|nr:hypothetical protein CMV_024957 [Castanea mollissima]
MARSTVVYYVWLERNVCMFCNNVKTKELIKRYSLQLKRDAANTWEVDFAFKPPDVLFSCFLGSMAHDHILEIIYCAVLEKLEQVQLARNNDSFEMAVKISPKINKGWFSLLWLPFLPLIIILLVGTKLQVIITKMDLRIQERECLSTGLLCVDLASIWVKILLS